jgi:ferredoxin-NADP reductase
VVVPSVRALLWPPKVPSYLNDMITGVKRFGSYVRQEFIDRDDDDITEPPMKLSGSSCALPAHFVDLQLLAVRPYNHDTSVFEFALPTGEDTLRLPVGAHILVRSGDTIRPYTSLHSSDGKFELMIKRYDEWGVLESLSNNSLFTRTDHSFKPRGEMSSAVHNLRVGQSLSFKHTKQCLGKLQFPYVGVDTITMIAVGIGVVPMINIIKAFIAREEWNTRIALIYGVVSYCLVSRVNEGVCHG